MKLATPSIPEKTFQDSQRTTDLLTVQAQDLGKYKAQVKALEKQLEDDAKKITVTLKTESPKVKVHDLMWGTRVFQGGLDVQSIEIKNVDEADKFLTTVLESEISQERDEAVKKAEKHETKLDEKDREITTLKRQATRMKETHSDQRQDLDDHYEREIIKARKTAKGKIQKQLVEKDVEYATLNNTLELERQEANLREIELLGNLKHYKAANDALEAKVTEVKAESPKLLGALGNYINKMTGYRKALKSVEDFTKRNPSGRIGGMGNPFTITW